MIDVSKLGRTDVRAKHCKCATLDTCKDGQNDLPGTSGAPDVLPVRQVEQMCKALDIAMLERMCKAPYRLYLQGRAGVLQDRTDVQSIADGRLHLHFLAYLSYFIIVLILASTVRRQRPPVNEFRHAFGSTCSQIYIRFPVGKIPSLQVNNYSVCLSF